MYRDEVIINLIKLRPPSANQDKDRWPPTLLSLRSSSSSAMFNGLLDLLANPNLVDPDRLYMALPEQSPLIVRPARVYAYGIGPDVQATIRLLVTQEKLSQIEISDPFSSGRLVENVYRRGVTGSIRPGDITTWVDRELPPDSHFALQDAVRVEDGRNVGRMGGFLIQSWVKESVDERVIMATNAWIRQFGAGVLSLG